MSYEVREHILPFLHHVGFTVSDMDRSIDFTVISLVSNYLTAGRSL